MTLHLLHLPVHPRALMQCGREHKLVDGAWSADLGYLLHALFARLLGRDAPEPFSVQDPPDGPASDARLPVLAYSGRGIDALAEAARGCGDAPALDAIAWERAASKPMPRLEFGQRVGFRVRTCPAVRVGKHHPLFRPGAEVDPYLVELKRRDPDAREGQAPDLPLREAIYRDWLAARIGPAAELAEARLLSMRDARLWRKGVPRDGDLMHGRPRRDLVRNGRAPIGRRDALFEGALTVQDPDAFHALLARGVGRHRAFGFGMLLLRAIG